MSSISMRKFVSLERDVKTYLYVHLRDCKDEIQHFPLSGRHLIYVRYVSMLSRRQLTMQKYTHDTRSFCFVAILQRLTDGVHRVCKKYPTVLSVYINIVICAYQMFVWVSGWFQVSEIFDTNYLNWSTWMSSACLNPLN